MTPFEARCALDDNEIELFVKLYAKTMGLDISLEDNGLVTLRSNTFPSFKNMYFHHSVYKYQSLLSNIISFDNDFMHTWKSTGELRIWFDLNKHLVE